MKLRQRPQEFPLGVLKFKFSDEHSLPFHIGAPLPPLPLDFQMSNGSEGVMERNRPIPTTWKIINVFQLKKERRNQYCHLYIPRELSLHIAGARNLN